MDEPAAIVKMLYRGNYMWSVNFAMFSMTFATKFFDLYRFL